MENKYTVSKTTALYLDAIKANNDLLDAVTKAVKAHYMGDLSVLDKGFNDAYDNLTAELYALLTRSINDNVCFSEISEI